MVWLDSLKMDVRPLSRSNMRDPQRIEPTLKLLEELWKKYPDMRLGQLIENLASDANLDAWTIEDSELQQTLNKWLKELRENE